MCDALFDSVFDGRCLCRVPDFLPIEDLGDFTIGYITGASGSLKTILARNHFPHFTYYRLGGNETMHWESPPKSVVSHYSSLDEARKRLDCVGLNQCFNSTYWALSRG